MLKNYLNIIKGSSIIGVFRGAGAMSLMLSSILVSQSYGPEALGILNLILSIFMITMIFGIMGLDLFLAKEMPRARTAERNASSLILKCLMYQIIFTSLTIFIFNILFSLIDFKLFPGADLEEYRIKLSICIFLYNFNALTPEIYRGYGDIRRFAIFKSSFQNLILFFTLLFSLAFQEKNIIKMIFLAISASFFVQLCIFIKFFMQKRLRLKYFSYYNMPILSVSSPMFITMSSLTMMGYIDIFIIGYFYGESFVGLYSSVVQLSLLTVFILGAINSYLAPHISISYAKGRTDELTALYKNSVILSVSTSLPIFLILFIFPDAFLNLYGDLHVHNSMTLRILLVGYLINNIFGPVGHFMNLTGRHMAYMFIISSGLFINIILNLFLIPIFSLNGAAIASSVSFCFWNVTSFWYLKRNLFIKSSHTK